MSDEGIIILVLVGALVLGAVGVAVYLVQQQRAVERARRALDRKKLQIRDRQKQLKVEIETDLVRKTAEIRRSHEAEIDALELEKARLEAMFQKDPKLLSEYLNNAGS